MSLAWLNELLQIIFGLLPRPKIIRSDQELIEFRLGVEVLDFVITNSTTSRSYSLWELTNYGG